MSDGVLLLVLTLAAYRVWRLLAIDALPPLIWLRKAAERAIDGRFGPTWAAGVACSWCSGAWLSFGVVAAVWAVRPLTLPALWFGAVSAGVGLLSQRDDG